MGLENAVTSRKASRSMVAIEPGLARRLGTRFVSRATREAVGWCSSNGTSVLPATQDKLGHSGSERDQGKHKPESLRNIQIPAGRSAQG
jgi:hypothetical protein